MSNKPDTSNDTKPQSDQEKLIAYVKDPENIKRAAEGSMNKRARVLYPDDYGDHQPQSVGVEMKSNTSTWANYKTTWNRKNSESMIKIYQNQLNATPFWQIFKRRELKISIKLWNRIKKNYGK